MSCHYSCATCSSSTYMFNCLSCPSTRQLVDSTCVCETGYYDAQQSSCYPSAQADYVSRIVLPIADGLYYSNIALFWLYIIALFCRVNSPKIRIIVNFSQILALINYYPFVFDQISKQFNWTISSLNFNYYLSLFTCSDSLICKLFQYIWEPLLILPSLIVCWLLSYLLTNICYKYSLSESITLKNYWVLNWPMVIFYFFDLTAVIYGYNIAKSIMLSYWGFVFFAIYLIVLAIIVVKFFRIVNSPHQSKVLYRVKHGWAYGYDQYYHLYFIDFLYEEARLKKNEKQGEKQIGMDTLRTTQSIKQQTKEKKQQNKQKEKEDQIKMFSPHSNLYLLELLIKLSLGCSTALLYQYKPTLVVLSLIVLLLIGVCWLGAFFYYDKLTLLLYFVLSICTILFSCTYWLSFYWLISMGLAFFVTGLMTSILVLLFFINSKINAKLINKMYVDVDENQKIIRKQNFSQQQLNNKVENQQQDKAQNEQNSINPLQNEGEVKATQTKTKRQPFVGNLTRKTRPPTQNIVPQDDVLKPQPKVNKKSKTIFTDSIKQQEDAQQGQKGVDVIRHSKHQSKLSDIRSKVSAKSRTKNVFDNLEPISQQNNEKQKERSAKSARNNENLTERNNSKTKLNEGIQKNNNTGQKAQRTKSRFNKTDDLQNVLKQPSEVENGKIGKNGVQQ